jgi:hypothetical protein
MAWKALRSRLCEKCNPVSSFLASSVFASTRVSSVCIPIKPWVEASRPVQNLIALLQNLSCAVAMWASASAMLVATVLNVPTVACAPIFSSIDLYSQVRQGGQYIVEVGARLST